jgi:AraC-like DNA-binding protein
LQDKQSLKKTGQNAAAMLLFLREVITMNWIADIQRAIDYIEAHLPESVSADEVAAHIHSSGDYFNKLFLIVTGFTVSQYIRNRKLTLAAFELLNPRSKVIDVALKYGYETPESFARAFTRFHGTVPSKAKRGPLSRFNPLKIKITITGGFSMNKEILSWATDENQKFRLHNNTEDGIYKVNPSTDEIEQLLENMGKAHANSDVPKYDFLILDSKTSLRGESMYMQTAFDEGQYVVEAAWFIDLGNDFAKGYHYRAILSDLEEVKRLFVSFSMGIAPDVTGWEDRSEVFPTHTNKDLMELQRQRNDGTLTQEEYVLKCMELTAQAPSDASDTSWA